ncbi:uncharacterized protein LOC143247649 isoform X2 [Tachypleus tridentatus]|uniref:uncharacterized protein LOC143247649 isoform X2 n=1 Tax=Tachypleus tridentatus TaxID=6853 RepID=UPI003FD44A14
MIDELKVSRTLSYNENETLCASQTCVADLRTQNEGFSITKTGDFVPTDEVCVSCPNLHTLENSFDKNSDTDCCPQYFNFHLSNDGLYSHDENNILRLNKPENSHLVRKDKWDMVFGNKVGKKYSNDETFGKRYNHCIKETNVERVTSNAMDNVHVDQLSPIQDLNDWIQSVETSENFLELQSVKDESLKRTRSNVEERSLENHDSKHMYSGETHGKTPIKQKVCDCTCVTDHHESLLMCMGSFHWTELV